MARRDDLKNRLEGVAYQAAREGDLVEVVRSLMALWDDLEQRAHIDEDLMFQLAQRVDMAEKRLAEIPSGSELGTIRRLVFGDAELGLEGLLLTMRGLQDEVRRLGRGVTLMQNTIWGLLALVGAAVAVAAGAVVLWLG